MITITVHDLDNRMLAFDIGDILRLLAPLSLEATWTITSPKESPFEATGAGGVVLEGLARTSARISGMYLLSIAEDTTQVIWGQFEGTLPAQPLEKWLTIRAFDSTCYEISTLDLTSINKIRSEFNDVRTAHAAL